MYANVCKFLGNDHKTLVSQVALTEMLLFFTLDKYVGNFNGAVPVSKPVFQCLTRKHIFSPKFFMMR